MHPIVKNIITGVATGFLISSVATTASVIITSKEHAIQIKTLEAQMRDCQARCDRMAGDIYRPSWD